MKWQPICTCTDAIQAGGGVIVRVLGPEDAVAMVYVPDARLVGGCGEYSKIEEVIKIKDLMPPPQAPPWGSAP